MRHALAHMVKKRPAPFSLRLYNHRILIVFFDEKYDFDQSFDCHDACRPCRMGRRPES